MEKVIFTQEEEQRIQHEFDVLVEAYENSMHRQNTEIIRRAFLFAKQAHDGVRRLSGEPYILHPIAVAQIVVKEIGLGSTSVCSALLHDVVEDTDYTVEDIQGLFGDKIANIVDGLTKISGGVFGDQASEQAENFRKLLLTMSDDIRVVLVKIADRLHNMRTLSAQPKDKQYKIAGETLYIYAPLAHRLGLFPIKSELENLSFKYEHPDTYKEIEDKLAAIKDNQLECFENFSQPIKEKLQAMGYEFTMRARIKSVYSIYKKMKNKGIPFEDVYDLMAVRIIFTPHEGLPEKDQCWMIYSAITEIYRPHPERIRDWISTPKANGYEALHITVMASNGQWIEVPAPLSALQNEDWLHIGNTKLENEEKTNLINGCVPSKRFSITQNRMPLSSLTHSNSISLHARYLSSLRAETSRRCRKALLLLTLLSNCIPNSENIVSARKSTMNCSLCHTSSRAVTKSRFLPLLHNTHNKSGSAW